MTGIALQTCHVGLPVPTNPLHDITQKKYLKIISFGFHLLFGATTGLTTAIPPGTPYLVLHEVHQLRIFGRPLNSLILAASYCNYCPEGRFLCWQTLPQKRPGAESSSYTELCWISEQRAKKKTVHQPRDILQFNQAGSEIVSED